MPAAWVGPGCREKRVNFRRDRWLHGPDSESPTGKAGRHSRSTVAGLGEKRRLFFLYSLTVSSHLYLDVFDRVDDKVKTQPTRRFFESHYYNLSERFL